MNQYEEAITNYVRVIHEVSQESTSKILISSGLSAIARIGLINVYAVACIPYLSMGRNIPDESNRHVCELADDIARSEFQEWWEILG